MLDRLEYLETPNATAGSAYEGRLNIYRVGVVGHSAGAAGVVMFVSSGELDTEIPFSHPQFLFTSATQPIFWGHRRGSTHHDPLGDTTLYGRPLTA